MGPLIAYPDVIERLKVSLIVSDEDEGKDEDEDEENMSE